MYNLVKVYGAQVIGIKATTITIEVNTARGIKFFLVGLADAAVKESHERIVSAMNYNGYHFPSSQIIVNMAPADVRKEGAAYDLPLAIGIMGAAEMVETKNLSRYMMVGELGLDGTLQPIKGALPIALAAQRDGFEGLITPLQNAREAAVVDNLKVYGAENLKEVIDFFNGTNSLKQTIVDARKEFFSERKLYDYDFSDVKGQESVKRALEIAAAGGHNLIMVGPPGSGKSMMAKCLPSILPPLSLEESLETTQVHSVAGLLESGMALITRRPFRSPHHSISPVALVGGGQHAQPGEVSLANHGVLYTDELAEFPRNSLEVLRQPLEDRKITISRSRYTVEYPCSVMLVASTNPCPCGFYNHPTRECVCTPTQVQKYMNRISGPMLDRIDLHIEIFPLSFQELSQSSKGEASAVIRERVVCARKVQENRFKDFPHVHCNAQMTSRMISQFAVPSKEALLLLKNAMEKLDLSARAYDRILKVARTIADLAGSEDIESMHVAEAISYRMLDRGNWATR